MGRIVHYAAAGTICRAAIVTDVSDVGEVSLCVLEPWGMSFDLHVQEAGLIENTVIHPPGTWHWPERVD